MASGSSEKEKDKDSRWYFTAEVLANSPSRKCGIEADMELNYRQQAANLIQSMGQQLHVSQLCINTAIVYMHRFYAFHSFSNFHRNGIAQASLFLAAKVEEQPRKLEHVIKEAHKCLQLVEPTKEAYLELSQDLVFNENVLLQTLGFDVAIDHPHTHVVKTCHLVKASKDLAQTSYFMASNSLHLTTMCLQYRPTVVACFCIHLACKWSRWEIPQSTERKHWFQYVDKTVTIELLQKLTEEFLHIFDRCPSRLKTKMKSMSSSAQRTEDPTKGLPGPSSSSSSQSGEAANSNHHHRHHHAHHHGKVPHEHHSSKPSSQIPGSASYKPTHPVPSSSSINRSRSERPPVPPPSSSYVPTMNQHPPHSSTSKNIPPNVHGSSSSTNSSSRPISSSSQKIPNIVGENPNYPAPIGNSREINHKNRNAIGAQPIPNPATGHNHKLDQRHLMKDGTTKIDYKNQQQQNVDFNKANMIKSDPNALFLNTTRTESVKNSTNNKSAPQYTSNQPPLISSRNQSQHQIIDHSSQKPITDSFKLIDDTNHIVEPMQMCTPPKQSKASSIFSPDYKDTTLPVSNPNNSRSNSINLNIKSNKDSPTNSKNKPNYPYDRKLDTPKKDKKNQEQSSSKLSNSSEKRSNNNKKSIEPISNIPGNNSQQQQFISQSYETMNPMKMGSGTSSKRPFAEISMKQDNSLEFRESKMPKIETELSNSRSPQCLYDPNRLNLNMSSNSNSSFDAMYGAETKSSKLFPGNVNGIETNPDVISSLLKEACSDFKFGTSFNPTPVTSVPVTQIQTTSKMQNPLPVNISNVEPQLKLESHVKIEPQQIKMDPIESLSAIEEPILATQSLSQPLIIPKTEPEEVQRTKSEKKKKKDKHKHKEKEKSKEERKKHKKDKDRHKDREIKSPPSETSQDPTAFESRIRITIPKEKLSLPSSELNTSNSSHNTFKIKIPKDIIKPEIAGYSSNSSYYISDQSTQNQQAAPQQTSSLKIKIPKVMIENCNSSHSDSVQVHRSGKKKDRDRDREKGSKSSKADLSKSFNGNGNNSNNPGSNGGGQINRNTTSSSSSNQNKILPPYNMSNVNPVQHQYQQNNTLNPAYGRIQDPNNKFNVSNNNFYYSNNRISNDNVNQSSK